MPADDTINFEIAHLRQKEFLPIIMAYMDSHETNLEKFI